MGGKKLTGWGKNGPAYSFPGEKTDWGEIPACYTGLNFHVFMAHFSTQKSCEKKGALMAFKEENAKFT